MKRAALLLALLLPSAAQAADLFGGYSTLRLEGASASGASAGATWAVSGPFRLAAEATATRGGVQGGDLSEWSLLAGPFFAPRRDGRLRPFVEAKAGLVRSRRQLDVFGVAIGALGVCEDGCPHETGFAAELGGGLDIGLGERLALRLPQIDYRLARLASDDASRLRVSAGIVWRWGR